MRHYVRRSTEIPANRLAKLSKRLELREGVFRYDNDLAVDVDVEELPLLYNHLDSLDVTIHAQRDYHWFWPLLEDFQSPWAFECFAFAGRRTRVNVYAREFGRTVSVGRGSAKPGAVKSVLDGLSEELGVADSLTWAENAEHELGISCTIQAGSVQISEIDGRAEADVQPESIVVQCISGEWRVHVGRDRAKNLLSPAAIDAMGLERDYCFFRVAPGTYEAARKATRKHGAKNVRVGYHIGQSFDAKEIVAEPVEEPTLFGWYMIAEKTIQGSVAILKSPPKSYEMIITIREGMDDDVQELYYDLEDCAAG